MNSSPLLSIYVSVRELDFWIISLCKPHPERRSWGCPMPRPDSSLVYGIMRRETTIMALPEHRVGFRGTIAPRTCERNISVYPVLQS